MQVTESSESSNLVELAQTVLSSEAEAIQRCSQRLDRNFHDASEVLASVNGRVVTCGLGKSGIVARKTAATMTSAGIPSLYIHPVDALHGDIGNVLATDAVVLFSYSGMTSEVIDFGRACRSRGVPIVAVVGDVESVLGRMADYAIDASVAPGSDALGVIPTASSTVAVAIGDALTIAIMTVRRLAIADFLHNHPSGTIGRTGLLTVSDLMHPLAECALVGPADEMSNVLLKMTQHPLGAAVVVIGSKMLGIVSEGDLRRGIQKEPMEFLTCSAERFMSKNPRTVYDTQLAIDALESMERPNPVYVMPVIDDRGILRGVLRMHDIVKAGLKLRKQDP